LENLQQRVEKKTKKCGKKPHTQEDNFPNIKFFLMIIKHIDIFKSFVYNTHYFKIVIILTSKNALHHFEKTLPIGYLQESQIVVPKYNRAFSELPKLMHIQACFFELPKLLNYFNYHHISFFEL
jgi:hypothetical protein